MFLEASVAFGWMVLSGAGCWTIWRLAYSQGREDERTTPCCHDRWGHDDVEPVVDPDWGLVVSPTHPARLN
jgi:hypothetical protein